MLDSIKKFLEKQDEARRGLGFGSYVPMDENLAIGLIIVVSIALFLMLQDNIAGIVTGISSLTTGS